MGYRISECGGWVVCRRTPHRLALSFEAHHGQAPNEGTYEALCHRRNQSLQGLAQVGGTLDDSPTTRALGRIRWGKLSLRLSRSIKRRVYCQAGKLLRGKQTSASFSWNCLESLGKAIRSNVRHFGKRQTKSCPSLSPPSNLQKPGDNDNLLRYLISNIRYLSGLISHI